MAAPSPVATHKMRSSHYRLLCDHDPGATTAILTSADGGTTIKYVDMSLYGNLLVQAIVTIPATGALTLLEIVVATDAAFTTPVQAKTSGTLVGDAVADQATLEVSAEEIAQMSSEAGVKYRYATARLTMSNAGAEAVVLLEAVPDFPRKDLTPATLIA